MILDDIDAARRRLATPAPIPRAPGRVAALHALRLGGVFSMGFDHAPIIPPAVLRMKLPSHACCDPPLAGQRANGAPRAHRDLSAQLAARAAEVSGRTVAIARALVLQVSRVAGTRRGTG